ncbi:DUF3325 domain-containing protein [Janthinobacterium sp. 1_2014MBL_MicDiv]|uniref:DUF3325 domain-containing protein n=1 Tax=Janthinobacterium sp. 1_2014MBL_MicDiv TaxID=1644131 RepID=UPI0008F50C63|nr:DUF3325 domain-containing protein [Janthinobacterium sp. 1_2014MBL_MicDiv]APA68035.1 hypothetical protein YQ44_09505 [Janthinobacterium sp. 1_2014MBL_MicDiv]
MPELLAWILLFAGSHACFVLLALSQERHWQAVGAAAMPVHAASRGRLCGYAGLALLYGVAVAREGAGFGSISWCMLLFFGAMTVALTLSWAPRRLRWAAWLLR